MGSGYHTCLFLTILVTGCTTKSNETSNETPTTPSKNAITTQNNQIVANKTNHGVVLNSNQIIPTSNPSEPSKENIADNKHHESLPYQIYFVSNGLCFITGKVDVQKHILQVEYLAREIDFMEINVGAMTDNGKDLEILTTFEIKNEKLGPRETTKIRNVPIPGFKEGLKLVLWIKNENRKSANFVPFEKQNILERVFLPCRHHSQIALSANLPMFRKVNLSVGDKTSQ